MRIAVVGSRDLDLKHYSRIKQYIEEFEILEIVSGGASGCDTMAEQIAQELDIPFKLFPADWSKHGRSAGPIRNQQIAEYSDACFAFINKPIGQSRGTRDCVDRFTRLNKFVEVIELND